MNISTHEKTVKAHTVCLDDNEVIRLLDNPDEITDLLNSLLTAKPVETNGQKPIAHKHGPRIGKRKQPVVHCQYCARAIAQGWIDRHESTYPQRPAVMPAPIVAE